MGLQRSEQPSESKEQHLILQRLHGTVLRSAIYSTAGRNLHNQQEKKQNQTKLMRRQK